MSSGTDQAQSWGLVKCTSDCLHDLIVVGCCIFIGDGRAAWLCLLFTIRHADAMRCDKSSYQPTGGAVREIRAKLWEKVTCVSGIGTEGLEPKPSAREYLCSRCRHNIIRKGQRTKADGENSIRFTRDRAMMAVMGKCRCEVSFCRKSRVYGHIVHVVGWIWYSKLKNCITVAIPYYECI